MPAIDIVVPPRLGRIRSRRLVVRAIVAMVLVGVTACSSSKNSGGLAAPSSPVSLSPSPSASFASASPSLSPSASPSDSDSASPVTEAGCVAATTSKLSLADQVNQIVMLGTPATNPAAAVAMVRKYHVGGVFLAGRSSPSAASLRKAIAALQTAASASGGIGLQIALDQEGGEVQTLSGADFPRIPSAVQQGKWSSSALRSQTIAWAKRLAAVGITMDLAPVADTVPAGTAHQNPPIGQLDRQFGSNPSTVADDIATVVSAAQSTGIITTLKHFPGLGRVRTNTDFGTGATDSVATTDDPYLGPFASGIRAGSGAVMISLASYPKLDSHSIAAFSEPIVTELLRKQLGFTGLIVSDDLGATAAVKSVPIGQRAVRFVAAGGDMALSVRTSDAKPITSALLTEARRSSAFAAKVTAAAAKVLGSKYESGVLTCGPQP